MPKKNFKNASMEFFPFPFCSSNKGLLGMSMIQGYIIHLYIFFKKSMYKMVINQSLKFIMNTSYLELLIFQKDFKVIF